MTETTTEAPLTIDEILTAFTPVEQPYQRAAVEAALQQRAAIIPYLIQVLERALADPAGQDESVAHLYALMLLGHFRASAAHEVIVRLFRLPKADDWAYRLFGDTVTEDLPIILLRTCGGSVAQIQELILDRQANEYCRGSGARALTYAVAEGFSSREAALEFLSALFTGEEADTESSFWSQLMVDVNRLYPAGLTETLQAAFDRGLIDESVIGMEDIEETIETESIDEDLQTLRDEMARNKLDNIHASMAWWAMFDDSPGAVAESGTRSTRAADDAQQHKKEAAAQAKKKQKRKMAKATRKKNRQKK